MLVRHLQNCLTSRTNQEKLLQILVTGQESNKITGDNGFIHGLDGGSSRDTKEGQDLSLGRYRCPHPVSRHHSKQILKTKYKCPHDGIQAALGGRKRNLQVSAGCDFT